MDFSSPLYINEVGFASGNSKPIISITICLEPFSEVLWASLLLLIGVVSSVFTMVYLVHRKIGNPNIKHLAIWEIPLQTFESLIELRMVNFFGEKISSARLLRGPFSLFATFMGIHYSSMLRAALFAKAGDGVIDTFEDMIEKQMPLYTPKHSPPELYVAVSIHLHQGCPKFWAGGPHLV